MSDPLRKPRAITSEKVDQDRPAFRIIAKFGGLTRFCEITGFPISTVHGWTVTGLIPNRKRDGVGIPAFIMNKGAEIGVSIDPSEFIDMPTVSPPPDGECAAASGIASPAARSRRANTGQANGQ